MIRSIVNLACSIFLLCLVLFINSVYSVEDSSKVKIIYFIPTDRSIQWDINTTLDEKIKKVQSFFSDQLSEHGYEKKTFQIETNDNDQVIVHLVIGQSEDMYYKEDTHHKIVNEIKTRFDVEKDIYLIVADLSYELINGGCGIATLNGGPVTIPASGDCFEGNTGIYLIAHELGHAFNLRHDYRDNTYIMSQGLDTRRNFSKCAAAVLNVSPFLNPVGSSDNSSAIIEMLTPTTYAHDEKNFSVEFNVSDVDGLYLVEFSHAFGNREVSVKGCKDISDLQTTKVKFDMPEDAVFVQFNQIRIRLFDQNGYITEFSRTLRLEDSIEKEENSMYLTLFYDSPDALTPINSQVEWNGWVRFDPIWERLPGSPPPTKPNYYIDFPHQNTWIHWFYAHASAKYIYDISDKHYTLFETIFYLPNSCVAFEGDTDIASVQLTLYADGIEIYNSGVLLGQMKDEDNMHEISVDIPVGTQEFSIDVSEAIRGSGCDHFIFANPLLYYEESLENTDVNNDNVVNVIDLVLVAARYGEKITGDPFPNPDVNRDGIVDVNDIILITKDMPLDESASFISNKGFQHEQADDILPADIVNRGITTLNQLFRMDTPTETLLLNNYPNPFNPETWIPYQLSETTDVIIIIYASNGNIVRQLDIGERSAGHYLTRDRAAYWDGKNTIGEYVSTGIYFYTLQVDTFNATRKMVIIK